MTSKTRYNGNALRREAPTELRPTERYDLGQAYAPCADLQRRYLMRRWGVGPRQASLIAALCFGEDRK
jgi:hypothetical protein